MALGIVMAVALTAYVAEMETLAKIEERSPLTKASAGCVYGRVWGFINFNAQAPPTLTLYLHSHLHHHLHLCQRQQQEER